MLKSTMQVEGAANVPVTFAGCSLVEVLGRGGMATVVKARPPAGSGLPRYVAIKFLHRSLCNNADAVNAFRHEAAIGMTLRHPGLCRVFAYEVVDGRHSLIMEHIEGFSLSKIMQQLVCVHSPADQFATARILIETARALHALHTMADPRGRAAVHRDVTPQNIILTPSGHAKLIDYGVTYLPSRTIKTRQGAIKGKMAYLPPEYLLHESWDRRLDVWSLGVVAWELLTSRRLFRRHQMADTIHAIMTYEVPPPVHPGRGIERELQEIVLRMLDRDPRARQRSAEQVADELSDFLVDREPEPGIVVADWLGTLPLGFVSGVLAAAPPVWQQSASESLSPPWEGD